MASTVQWNPTCDLVESDKYMIVNATLKSKVFPFTPAFIYLALQVSEFLVGQDNDAHTLNYIVLKAFHKHSQIFNEKSIRGNDVIHVLSSVTFSCYY